MSFQYIPENVVKVPDIPFKEKIELAARRIALVIVDMHKPNTMQPIYALIQSARSSIIIRRPKI